ncbi:hypothetical protein CCH79_00018867, partial [Gambusia affinis]
MCMFSFYTELLSAGLLKPLDCHIEGLQHKEGNKNYVTPLGTSSVVKHFLSESVNTSKTKELIVDYRRSRRTVHTPITIQGKVVEYMDNINLLGICISLDLTWNTSFLMRKLKKAELPTQLLKNLRRAVIESIAVAKEQLFPKSSDLYLEYHVTGLHRCGASWKVERNGGNEKFDAVVLTIPVPQILQLQGDLGNLLSVQQREQLEGVRYSSRFAIALFFSPDVVFSFSWGARYITDSHCIRYIAVDNKKRSSDAPGLGPSLVVHTSVPFGLEHLENDKDAIQPIILQELHRLLPDLPQPVSIKFQKWRYSQVLTSVPNCPGHMTILEQPLLICGGDAFTHSNFDGCVESALSVCRALQLSLD